MKMFGEKFLLLKNCLLCVCVIILITPMSCQIPATSSGKRLQTRLREKQILDRILSSNNKYDTNIRPSGGTSETEETQVTVNLMVNSISKIDDFNMEYRAQLTLRMEWNDDRLNYSDQDPLKTIRYLTISDQKRIWMPDVFFINEKDGHFHNIIMPNVLIRIFPDGKVIISIRMSLTLSCPMDLQLFPMDTQTCSVVMASYAWTTQDLVFKWREQDAVQLPPNLTLPRFSLTDTKTNQCDRHTVTGTYSCIRVDFTLIRNLNFYFFQNYFPCILLVIVSWVSFWIDENAVPARTALGITTLLTMATQQANMNKNLPPVSYIKALDVWSGTCLVFIFAALLEYALVNYATRFDKRSKASAHSEIPGREPEHSTGCLYWRITSTSKKIDLSARVMFPTLFIIFNIVYWVLYLIVLS